MLSWRAAVHNVEIVPSALPKSILIIISAPYANDFLSPANGLDSLLGEGAGPHGRCSFPGWPHNRNELVYRQDFIMGNGIFIEDFDMVPPP